MQAIHRRGWCDGSGGNFSVVLQRGPQLQLLMAPSGVDKGRVRPGELILVAGSGEVLSGQGRVSAEMPLHRTIVLTTGAGAVLHTHSQAATLLSMQAMQAQTRTQAHRQSVTGPMATHAPADSDALQPAAQCDEHPAVVSHVEIEGYEMLKGLEGNHSHQCRIHIPVLANDQNLIRLSHAAQSHLHRAPHGILIAGHGLYAWGEDLSQAMRHLEVLEFLLEQRWRQGLWEAMNRKP